MLRLLRSSNFAILHYAEPFLSEQDQPVAKSRQIGLYGETGSNFAGTGFNPGTTIIPKFHLHMLVQTDLQFISCTNSCRSGQQSRFTDVDSGGPRGYCCLRCRCADHWRADIVTSAEGDEIFVRILFQNLGFLSLEKMQASLFEI